MEKPELSQPGASPILNRELQKSLSCKSCSSCQNVCFLVAAGRAGLLAPFRGYFILFHPADSSVKALSYSENSHSSLDLKAGRRHQARYFNAISCPLSVNADRKCHSGRGQDRQAE